MGMDPPQAGASGGGGHDLGHPAGAEGAMRRLDPYEHRPATGTRRTTAFEISSDRLTDIRGQWEAFRTICFASHDDLAGSPIDVVKRQPGDLARPQAKTDQHGQDREVATAVLRAAVAGRQKASDLVGIQSLGQADQSPAGDRRHCKGERSLDHAVDMKKAEQ